MLNKKLLLFSFENSNRNNTCIMRIDTGLHCHQDGHPQCQRLILCVQIIERNGTYFVVFMDSNLMPPLFRISNRSHVPIQFYQTEIREELPYT
ncbi:unnamed protein product [Rotaria sp. Silwood2]|nr:unnamed protein product [Rotaria sp. Silwood2]CAF4524979.1 unnamed protein product [Rotaria sp. Silwood2]